MLKIVTTSFTISSGGSGGVFAPSLFIGAMLGGCVGTLSHQLFPSLVPDVAPFVVVGMGAFFAGVANAPIASLMMVCELTGAYELLPPADGGGDRRARDLPRAGRSTRRRSTTSSSRVRTCGR